MPPEQSKQSEQPKKKWLNKNILGMGLTDFFSDTNHEMVSAILPIFLSSVLGAPAFALGLIEGVADGVSTIFEIWSGWYSDKIGKRKGIAATGYFIIVATLGTFALATNWLQVLIGRTLGWIGWSVRSPVRDALLLESTTPETIGRAFAFHGVMDTLGAIAGPLIATLLITRVPIRTIFIISIIPGICALLSILFFVKDKVRMRQKENTWRSVKSLSPNFFSFLLPVGMFGISNFAPTFLILRAQELLSIDKGTIEAAVIAVGLYTFSNVIYAIVNYPIGVMADTYSKKTILSVGYILFGIMCLGFIFADGHLWFFVALFALNGIYTSIVESAEPALAATLMNENQHGTGYGALSATDGLGDFLSSIIVGTLWTFISPICGFLFAGIVALLAGVMLYTLKFRAV